MGTDSNAQASSKAANPPQTNSAWHKNCEMDCVCKIQFLRYKALVTN